MHPVPTSSQFSGIPARQPEPDHLATPSRQNFQRDEPNTPTPLPEPQPTNLGF